MSVISPTVLCERGDDDGMAEDGTWWLDLI